MDSRYPRRNSAPVALAAQNTTQRVYIDAEQYFNVGFQVTYDAAFAGTIKAYASMQTAQPDVSAALSQSNEYIAAATARIDTAAVVSGATGYTIVAGSIGTIAASVQVDLVKWVCVEVVRTAGTFDLTVMKSNNG